MSNVPIDKLTSVYLKIKARRSELAAQFKEEDSALVEKQERIRKALLNYCKDNNVDSVKTPNGTFYRSAKTKYWTSDWDALVGLCNRGWFTVEKAVLLKLLRDSESFFDELITYS